jgi:hypothetical protein
MGRFMSSQARFVEWDEDGRACRACWRSLAGLPPPRRVVLADDRMPADAAFRLAAEGTALLWRGDFHNARQLLQAMARRIDRKPRQADPAAVIAAEDFHRYRLGQAQRARTLGMLLLPFDADFRIPCAGRPRCATPACRGLRAGRGGFRRLAARTAGRDRRPRMAQEGRSGPALVARIHPHYGVFAPVRGEYVDLVAKAPLPADCRLAFDIGTGTGVLAALLARRGVAQVVATDNDARAIACAAENIRRLGLAGRVEVVNADLFPPGQADLSSAIRPGCPGAPLRRWSGLYMTPTAACCEASSLALGPSGAARRGLADPVGSGRAPRPALARVAGGLRQAGLRGGGRLDRAGHPRAADRAMRFMPRARGKPPPSGGLRRDEIPPGPRALRICRRN